MVDEIPKALGDDRFFHKRGAHAHGHSADDLASRGYGIENTAGGTYSEHSPHADFSRCGVYGHLDEMRAEGRLLVAFVQIAILNGVLGPQKTGREPVCSPVTNAYRVCRLLLEKHKRL